MSDLPRTHRVLYLRGPRTVELRELAVPRPGPGELLLRVDAATTCGTDLKVYLRGGHPRMLRAPCPFGHEVCGSVVGCGEGVHGWREGDRLVVANSASCGRCRWCEAERENLCEDLRYLNGTFADFLLVPARFVRRSTYRISDRLDPAIAAMAEPLACVLHGIELAGEDLPDEALVVGAGPIGLMFAAELAARGLRVAVADPVDARREVALQLGAEIAIEVGGPDDVARLRAAVADTRGAPLVVEATGSPAGWETALAATGVGGTVVLFGGCPPGTMVSCDTHRLHYSEISILGVYHHRPATVAAAVERLEAGVLGLDPLIQDRRSLDEVEDALQRMERREILKAAILPSLS